MSGPLCRDRDHDPGGLPGADSAAPDIRGVQAVFQLLISGLRSHHRHHCAIGTSSALHSARPRAWSPVGPLPAHPPAQLSCQSHVGRPLAAAGDAGNHSPGHSACRDGTDYEWLCLINKRGCQECVGRRPAREHLVRVSSHTTEPSFEFALLFVHTPNLVPSFSVSSCTEKRSDDGHCLEISHVPRRDS